MQKISKFLCYILRHNPESIGVKLDLNGWAVIDDLIDKINTSKTSNKGLTINHDLLHEIVKTDDKARYSISEDGKNVRANQGHSIEINLMLDDAVPPSFLFHGTSRKNIKSISILGLTKKNRHHVHLSSSKDNALKVAARRHNPIILTIRSGEMSSNGFKFYISKNGVWLTERVPSKYIAEV